MVFGVGLINGDIYIYPQLATKFGTKLAITRLAYEIFANFCVYSGFLKMGHLMPPNAFSPDRPMLPWQRNLEQNLLQVGLCKTILRDFCTYGWFTGMGHRMLPIAISSSNPCCHGNGIWDKIGYSSVWQLDDVSRSLPQPTLISRYNEQQRSRSSSSSRHIQRSVPDRRYTAPL